MRTRSSEYFDGIHRGLQSAVQMLESGKKLTFDKLELPEEPNKMTGDQIAALRDRLNISQRVLAALLNVSAKTVQAWEHERNSPSGSSLRLLQIFEESPEVIRKILR